MRCTRLENDAIIEPSCSLNGLIRLSSAQHQSSNADVIIRHHETLKPAPPLHTHSTAAAAAAAAAVWAPETRPASNCPIHLSPRTSPGSRPSVRLSVPSNMDAMTSSSSHARSIPCQLRGRASVSRDVANETLSPNVAAARVGHLASYQTLYSAVLRPSREAKNAVTDTRHKLAGLR